MSKTPPSLHELELKVSYLLRVGVLIAGILLLSGWIWMWFQGGDISNKFSDYVKPISLFDGIQWALITNDRGALISFLGLIVLVVLPVFRVFMTGVLFFWHKEYRLGFMALFVFVALISSFVLGVSEI